MPCNNLKESDQQKRVRYGQCVQAWQRLRTGILLHHIVCGWGVNSQNFSGAGRKPACNEQPLHSQKDWCLVHDICHAFLDRLSFIKMLTVKFIPEQFADMSKLKVTSSLKLQLATHPMLRWLSSTASLEKDCPTSVLLGLSRSSKNTCTSSRHRSRNWQYWRQHAS